jgi:hypothetical protein
VCSKKGAKGNSGLKRGRGAKEAHKAESLSFRSSLAGSQNDRLQGQRE